MFINTLIYFEQKYFLRYGITFWFLLQVLLQEVTTICMLFVKRFVNQIHFYFYKKKMQILRNFEIRTSLDESKRIRNDFTL